MESLFPSIPKDDIVVEPQLFNPVFESVEYKIDQILDKIKHIDSLNEQEIKHIIIRQYHMILNYDTFLANERVSALELFTNKRFLKILLDVINTLDLSNDEIICINKLTYDYYVLSDKDAEISNLLLELSYFVNNKVAIRLSAILGIQGARILAMISRSSFKVEKNVSRVNWFIVKSNIAISEQDIINIYCTIYDRFMYPIIYTMLETEPETLSELERKRFRAISAVIVRLLNSMTSTDIYTVISNYAYTLQFSDTKDTRFSLKQAAKLNHLDRLSSIIAQVEFETEDNPVDL